MTNTINVQISGEPEAVLRLLNGLKQPEVKAEQPWWVSETPWFDRLGKLTPEEAADLEVSTYGKGAPKSREDRLAALFESSLTRYEKALRAVKL
jgi:hypothetical protein